MKKASQAMSTGLLRSHSISVVTNSEQLWTVWQTQKLILRANERRLLTPEIRKFCDTAVKKRILQDENLYIGIILHESLREIMSYLKRMKYKYFVQAYLSSDPYLPQWNGITILIKVNYRMFREKMKVWREIESQITNVFNLFKDENPEDIEQIEEANEIIATTIEKLTLQE